MIHSIIAVQIALMTIAEFGSVAEFADLARTGQAAVRSGVRNGTIPHLLVGRTIRIPMRMIVERLAAQVSDMDNAPDEVEGAADSSACVGEASHAG